MVDYTASELKEREDLLSRCLEEGVRQKEFAGASFLLVKDNEELIYLEKGAADREKGIPLKRNAIFRLYSLTKPVTAAAVLTLAEDGLLDLQDPVSRYFPSFANARVEQEPGRLVPAQREVTILDLLNMTSGLGYGDSVSEAGRSVTLLLTDLVARLDSDHPMTTEEFAARAGECPLSFEPGTSWQYGISADILGAVVEKTAGKPYDVFLRERILDPLEMKDTAFVLTKEQQERLVTAYRRRSADLLPFRNDILGIRNNGSPNAFMSGGAGLFSSIDDVYRFTQMLMRGGRGLNGCRVLRLGTVQYMTRHKLTAGPQKAFLQRMGLDGFTYSNLLRIMERPEEARTAGREGEYGWDGWMGTYWCNSPADGITLILMMNQEKYETGRVTHLVRNIVFG